MSKKAVVLLSGGLDSTTALAIASKEDGYGCYALAFDYEQRHKIELECARKQSILWNSKAYRVVQIDMGYIGVYDHDASLVNLDSEVPEMRGIEEMSDRIPSTYVPARNTIFLSYAAAYAEVVGAERIYTGMNALDYSGYPDCRPEYVEAYQRMLDLATKQGVEGNSPEIVAPLINLTKAEIILKGFELNVDYSLTNSCYNPKMSDDPYIISVPCGKCDSCLLRQKGFEEANEKLKELRVG